MVEETKPNETQQEPKEPVAPVVEESTPVDAEKEALRQELEKAQAEAKDYLDQLLRARADYANYKRRGEQDKKDLIRYGNAGLMTRLLPVLDDFERAFLAVPEGLDKLTWVNGIVLIHRKMQIVMEAEGLEAIRTTGQKFDPSQHEAITTEDRDDMEDGAIIAEAQKGYKLGDRVLRPTLVRVARHVPKPEPSAAPESKAENQETTDEHR